MQNLLLISRKLLYYALAVGCAVLGLLMWGLDPYLSRRGNRVHIDVGKVAAELEVFVFVAGAVRQPGTYVLPAAAHVADAITAAGGFTDNLDPDKLHQELNLATPVAEGMHIMVPIKARITEGQTSGRVNINTASVSELDQLPGIGPATAAKIVAARPFSRLEDLLNVPGIGESRLVQLESLVTW